MTPMGDRYRAVKEAHDALLSALVALGTDATLQGLDDVRIAARAAYEAAARLPVDAIGDALAR